MGRPGRILVRYGTSEDLARWGYALLGLEPLVEGAHGFPVVQAEVDYDGEGYAAMMAWIQIVRTHDLDNDERTTMIDRAPQLAGWICRMPPSGPGRCCSTRPAPMPAATWNAHATLMASPDCVMTRRVQPLCGFSWG